MPGCLRLCTDDAAGQALPRTPDRTTHRRDHRRMPQERMKRLTLILTSLCFALVLHAQDTTAVKTAVDKLEHALVAGDTSTLKALLHEDAAFGHSSGWVQ